MANAIGEVKMNVAARGASQVFLAIFLCFSLAGKAGAAPVDLTVMTQNLYVGADAAVVLADPTPATIAAAFRSVVANNFPARAAAIAKEAASAGGPLLIGLQEASIITAPTATLDYAQILIRALADQGLRYSATSHPGSFFDAGGFSVRDQDVVLARTDVPGFVVTGTEQHTFVNNVVVPTPAGPFALDNGYVLVNAALGGCRFNSSRPISIRSTRLCNRCKPARFSPGSGAPADRSLSSATSMQDRPRRPMPRCSPPALSM
jgi:hypothetical protein